MRRFANLRQYRTNSFIPPCPVDADVGAGWATAGQLVDSGMESASFAVRICGDLASVQFRFCPIVPKTPDRCKDGETGFRCSALSMIKGIASGRPQVFLPSQEAKFPDFLPNIQIIGHIV